MSELRLLRERLEERASEARLASQLKSLEQRVHRIEKRLESRASVPPDKPDAGDTIAGQLRAQLMPDMLQLISSNAMSGVFCVVSQGVENRMYFDEGQIRHAEGPGVVGESALFAALAAETGTYRFRETAELPEERTITGNTQFLILEALRQIDESGEP